MKKVYISIVAVLFVTCVFSVIQWQVTNRDLQTTRARVELLVSKAEYREAIMTQQEAEIQEQESLLESQEAEMAFKASQINSLESRNAELQYEVEALNAEIDKNRFTFYYDSLAKQRYGIDYLILYLDQWKRNEGAYVANRFDCAKMSAYLEWKLENEGYHTIIPVGERPWGNSKHVWLLVEISAGQYIPVEATTYSIVYPQNTYFDNYFVFTHSFETIQEAVNSLPIEFNWWE